MQTCHNFHVEQATWCTSKCSFLQDELQVHFLYGDLYAQKPVDTPDCINSSEF